MRKSVLENKGRFEMRKCQTIAWGLVIFCFMITGITLAEDKQPLVQKNESQKRNRHCSECDEFFTNISTKQLEIKTLQKKIKDLQDAEIEKEKAEAADYSQQLMTDEERSESLKKHLRRAKLEISGSDEQILEQLKQDNPEMYQLYVQQNKLLREIEALLKESRDCNAACLARMRNEK